MKAKAYVYRDMEFFSLKILGFHETMYAVLVSVAAGESRPPSKTDIIWPCFLKLHAFNGHH